MQRKPQTDEELRTALERTYKLRALLFHSELEKRGLHHLVSLVRELDTTGLSWKESDLGISDEARHRVKQARVPLPWVFCHRQVLLKKPEAVEYYRLLAAVSTKGLRQVIKGLKGDERLRAKVRAINTYISAIIEHSQKVSLKVMRDIMFAEAGSEIQGTWVNLVGTRAAQQVQDMIEKHANVMGIVDRVEKVKKPTAGKRATRRTVRLKNRWTIVFGSEPDIGIHDAEGEIQCAIEVKGSLDVAGAETRYGEAKKSFAKALKINPRCETIYLFSCMTSSVEKQIRNDGQVRKTYNLLEIFAEPTERRKFLDEVFRYIIRVK